MRESAGKGDVSEYEVRAHAYEHLGWMSSATQGNSNHGSRNNRDEAEPTENIAHRTVIMGVSTTILSFST